MKPELEKYWYLRDIKETFTELNTSKNGLTDEEANKRLKENGLNALAKEEGHKLLKIILRNCNSLLIYILLTAAIISLFSDHLVEFIAISIIVSITVILGIFQEYRAVKSVEALSKLTAKKVNVLRNGKWKEINSEHLVIGDIVSLHRGMIVPADLRIFENHNLSVDESILTGESVQKYKIEDKLTQQNIIISDQNNMLFSGTNVINGSCIAIVVETGLHSEIGKISLQLSKIQERPSPLYKQMNNLSKKISYAVITIALLFLIFLYLRGDNLFEALLLVSAISISGIPESLPLALIVTLSQGVKTMAKNNAIVKNLNSVETLGTTTVICTDKTGTLTQNKMMVEKIYLSNGDIISVKGKEYEPKSEFVCNDKKVNPINFKFAESFFRTSILCNNSTLDLEEGEWKLSGEPTEGALLSMARSANLNDEIIKENYPRLYEFPFDPSKKFMITIHKIKNKKTAYLKGAVEKIIEKCTHIRTSTNATKKLTKKEITNLKKQIMAFTNDSYRVLGLATKDLKIWNKSRPEKGIDKGYVFEGMVAIKDPIRPEVVQSIKECHDAGIKVIMITGDHKQTAESIGKEIGLLTEKNNLVLEGIEIDSMTDEELDKLISKVAIFARSTPEHKLRIVNSLQRNGEIVAMTGDGVNDAPALKQADIGVSMGKNGTDVARESSKMVLADDNFSTIVNAIKEGRRIYSNIRRFVYYLLAGNMTEVSLIVVSVILGLATPLTALMILFVNLVTSSIPAFALSVEPTHPKVMKQKPRNPKEKILSMYLIEKILVLVPILFLGTLSLFIWEIRTEGGSLDKARTLVFAAIIMFELFHAFNAKSLHTSIFNKNFFKNKYLFFAVGLSTLLTVLAIHTNIGQKIFGFIPLSLGEWTIIILISSLVVLVSEIIKKLIISEVREQNNLQGTQIKVQ